MSTYTQVPIIQNEIIQRSELTELNLRNITLQVDRVILKRLTDFTVFAMKAHITNLSHTSLKDIVLHVHNL